MTWLDDMFKEARKADDPHVFMHMTEEQYKKWRRRRPAFVAGADEVGYGAWAGPLKVCAVCAPIEWNLEGLKDSKSLTPKGIESMASKLYAEARKGNIIYQLVDVEPKRIDELGVLTVLRKATCLALQAVTEDVSSVLMIADGDMDLPGDEVSIPKADTFIPPVMAAAILAKQARDVYMKDMDEHYPGYGFITNVGYRSEVHIKALKEKGRSPLHRKSYKLKELGEK